MEKNTTQTKIVCVINTHDKIKSKDGKSLPSKFFTNRNSLLTDLFANDHIQMMYNISMVIFLGLLWNNFLQDFLNYGEINLGQKLIRKAFGKFHLVILIWIATFLISLLCYPSLRLWARIRIEMKPNSLQVKIWDKIWIWTTIVYYFAVQLYIPSRLVIQGQLPIMSRFVVLCESVRLIMKNHAFIRSNAPKVLQFKNHSDMKFPIPTFSKYLYFSFAPTLVYQDEYPKAKARNWTFVIKCFVDVIACIFFSSIVTEIILRSIQDVCTQDMRWADLIIIIFQNTLYGLLLTLIFFYLLLHSWMNAFAEMLYFGDRLFYKDWWTSRSYQRFYRTWNSVVHDWLYTYILKDCYEILMPGNKVMSRVTVLLVSAVFHELMLVIALGFFFPVFFLNYVIPSLLFWAVGESKHWMSNWAVLYAQGLGISVFIIMYTVEYLARSTCSGDVNAWYDFFPPQFIKCGCFV